MNDEIQIWRPDPLMLAEFRQNQSVSAEFGCAIPDPRLRVRLTVLAYLSVNETTPSTPVTVAGATIHLSAREKEALGRSGGLMLPVTNIVGTPSAGVPFPATSDVSGASWTWDGLGDEIYGKIFTPTTQSGTGTTRYQVQVVYTPMVRLCPAEWQRVKQQARLYALTQVRDFSVGSGS